LKPLARALQARGALVPTEHGGLALGGDARAILKGEVTVPIVLPPKKERRGKRDRAGGANPVGDPLFDALRALRRDLAQEAGMPPYVIFHDATLREIAAARPSSLRELGEVGGVGARKLEAYGEAFLAVVRQH
jgi:ATP-dependent DNA helicase RecQ